MTKVVIVESLRDPGLRSLSGRPSLIVTAHDYPPPRHLGANVVGMGVGACHVAELGNACVVVVATDGEQAGRVLVRSNRWRTALVVLPKGEERTALRLGDAQREAVATGKHVTVLEMEPTMCLELAFEDGAIVGLPAAGVRGFLSPPVVEAPSVPSEGPGLVHPEAPPATFSMIAPPDVDALEEP